MGSRGWRGEVQVGNAHARIEYGSRMRYVKKKEVMPCDKALIRQTKTRTGSHPRRLATYPLRLFESLRVPRSVSFPTPIWHCEPFKITFLSEVFDCKKGGRQRASDTGPYQNGPLRSYQNAVERTRFHHGGLPVSKTQNLATRGGMRKPKQTPNCWTKIDLGAALCQLHAQCEFS